MRKEGWPEYATWWDRNEGKVVLFFLFIETLLILVPILFREFLLANLDWSLIWIGVILVNSVIIPMIIPHDKKQ